MNAKTLLIVSAGIEAIPGIQLAKNLGLHVVVSDKDRQAPGIKFADEFIHASTYDVEQTVNAAREFNDTKLKIDGVMCIAADVPHTVAAVAHALNLPGISPQAAALSINKLAMKECFSANNIPTPWFRGIHNRAEYYKILKENPLPLIIKPIDSRGGRGVVRLIKGVDIDWAYDYALQFSASATLILERFLTGPQVSTESIIVNGKAYTPGYSDRNYEYLDTYAPHVIENGGNLPSLIPDDVQIKINTLIEQAAACIGIDNGVIKGDIVFHKEQPHIIEVAARLSGGYFCSHEIPLNTGVSTIKAVIQLSLGDPVDPKELKPRYMRAVSQRYMFPAPGKVLEVSGVDLARDIIGVEEVIVKVKPGDVIESPVDSNGWAGMIIAVGDTRDQADKHVFDAMRAISIKTEAL